MKLQMVVKELESFELHLDVIMMDIVMPEMNGIEATLSYFQKNGLKLEFSF